MDQQGKEYKGSHREGLVEVVSCFGDLGQERGQSVFYFSGEKTQQWGMCLALYYYGIVSEYILI
jgi:hypothetical protein